jgi:hypothetical protein
MRRYPTLLGIVWLVVACGFPARAQDAPPKGRDVLDRPEGKRLEGTFLGNLTDGFRFKPADGSAPVPIDGPAEIALGGDGPGPTAGVPPVQVVLGPGQRISGQLVLLDDRAIRLSDGPGGKPLTVERVGALELRQRPGEALVLIDGFETLDPTRWSHVGEPKIDVEPRIAGANSLRLAADGSAVTAKLAESIGQGRLELAYHDVPGVTKGAQWFVDLLFRGEGGPETIRAILGWSEESLAVQSSGGPVMVVQRLARKPGWHRLEIKFGPDASELAVDGDSLAHGKGPTGPLVEVRLGTSLASGRDPLPKLAVHIDEFKFVRLASVVSTTEVDPDQDEVRLVEGDQVFGSIRRADPQGVSIEVLGKPVTFSWGQVASLRFRRTASSSREVDGLLCRLDWRSAPGNDPRDLDQAEGALVNADATSFTLDTPYAGRIVIPRALLRRIVVERTGRRMVIDPTAHHLGNEVSKPTEPLDPPQPEGDTLERHFLLKDAPAAGTEATLVLDVVQVAGEANGLDFAEAIRNGGLRTKVFLNGREFDYINHYITSQNDTPERIRIPIPAGLLKPGENRLKFAQTAKNDQDKELDDLGILSIAIEVASTPARP